jgi:hypothetical protein
MKKVFLLLLTMFIVTSFYKIQNSTYVYVCRDGYQKEFHFDLSCKNIAFCEELEEHIPMSLAIKKGFSHCNNCSYVFVCNGYRSTKYHFNKNCKGLENCKGEIFKVSKNEAQNNGRTLCGYEK